MIRPVNSRLLVDILRYYFFITGTLFFVSTAVSMMRFPDLYARLHSTSKCLTGGSLSILLAYLLQLEMEPAALRTVLVTLFLLMTNPIASHALARSAYRQNLYTDNLDRDEYRDDYCVGDE